jgi:hypothetical protein
MSTPSAACVEAQAAILDHLMGLEHSSVWQPHVEECDCCREFLSAQRELEQGLMSEARVVLSIPRSNRVVRPVSPAAEPSWADWWPDAAHVAGCSVATILLFVILPSEVAPRGVVLAGGLAFTCISYFLQALLRES